MSQYLLDTDALSGASKRAPDLRFMNWFTGTEAGLLWTSRLSLGEIQKGIATLPASTKRAKLEYWLGEAMSAFENRIVAIDLQETLRWGGLLANAIKIGKTAPVIGGLIAAQCTQHKLTLATHNAKDFEQFTDLDGLNPGACKTVSDLNNARRVR